MPEYGTHGDPALSVAHIAHAKQTFNSEMGQLQMNDGSAAFANLPGYKPQGGAKDLSALPAQGHSDFSNQMHG